MLEEKEGCKAGFPLEVYYIRTGVKYVSVVNVLKRKSIKSHN